MFFTSTAALTTLSVVARLGVGVHYTEQLLLIVVVIVVNGILKIHILVIIN